MTRCICACKHLNAVIVWLCHEEGKNQRDYRRRWRYYCYCHQLIVVVVFSWRVSSKNTLAALRVQALVHHGAEAVVVYAHAGYVCAVEIRIDIYAAWGANGCAHIASIMA